jgi:uncharacterized protein (UPF0335 family)
MAKAANTSNDFDPHIVNALLRKIDGFDVDLVSERSSYMSKCRNIRESMKAVYDEAKAHGVPQKELRTLVKIRHKEREAAKLYNELETEQQENLAMLAATEKVADLPLWRAAKDRRPVPGVDVARSASGEHPEPMFEDNAKHANFKPLN